MSPFVIPSVFSAVDRFSPVVARMGNTLRTFEQRLSVAQATNERSFRRNTNIFSRTSSQMFDYAKSAFVVGGTIGTAGFTAKSIADYEDAVASFRTIVSELNNSDFSKFERQISAVALATKKSTIDVAQSFEKIAGLNPVFAETSEGLASMSAAAITLSKASRMDLGLAAENLTGIMNQFSLSANQADRAINALAAGQAVGAATITQTALAMTNLGSTAAGSNVSLEQSIGLIQTLAKFGVTGELAGHRLRSSITKIQGAGVGYSSGQFQIVDALTDLKKRYDGLGSAMAKDAFLEKTFGLEQIATGRILLSNIEVFKQFTANVTGTSEAQKAAAIMSNTLSNRLEELKNKWVTITTTSGTAEKSLSLVKGTLAFLERNMEGIVTVGSLVLGFFAAWKIAVTAQKVALLTLAGAQSAVNFAQGIGTVITGQYASACFATTAGIRGMATASFFLEMGLWGSLGVIGLVSGALFVLYSRLTDDYEAGMQLRKSLDQTKDGFRQLREPITMAQIALEKYNSAVDAYNERQDYMQHRLYSYNRGLLHGLAFDLTHPLQAIEGGVNNPTNVMQTPEQKDYFSGVKPGNYRLKQDNNVYINLSVDKSGNVVASSDSGNVSINNNLTPKIGSTSR